MHPVSTAFFLLGYGLVLPIATRLASVVVKQHRLALWGHQFGLLLVASGWLLRGQVLVALVHLAWMGVAHAWFVFSGRGRTKAAA